VIQRLRMTDRGWRIILPSALLFAWAASAAAGPIEYRGPIVYARHEGVPLRMTLATPKDPGVEPRPAVLLIHGGCWLFGTRSQLHWYTRRFAEKGYVAAAIQYRMMPKHRFPECVEDCKAAVRWLRLHAAEYHIDPDRIIALGNSAGGYLAAMLGATEPKDGFEGTVNLGASSAVQATIGMYGVYDLSGYRDPKGFFALRGITKSFVKRFVGKETPDHDTYKWASPMTYAHAGMGPVFLVHGTNDHIVRYEQSTAFRDQLTRLGVPVHMSTVPYGHVFDFLHASARQKVFDEILVFLKEHGLQPQGGFSMDGRPSIDPGNALPRHAMALRPDAIADTPFVQERHEPYPLDGGVRVVAVDASGSVWAGTDKGVYRLDRGNARWQAMTPKDEQGPVFALLSDGGSMWVGAWNGLFCDGIKIEAVGAPIAALAKTTGGMAAAGPDGLWIQEGGSWRHETPRWARSLRDMIAGPDGALWIATGNGLYRLKEGALRLYQDEKAILSSDVKSLAFDADGALWAGGFGGVTVYRDGDRASHFTPREGLPSVHVHAVAQGPGGIMWAGTKHGVTRYDGQSWSLRHSRRWLLDDDVRDVAFDADGTAWIATKKGVSAIVRESMTFAQKAAHFHGVCMQRHVREPWLVERCRLPVPGDVSKWEPEDDDNDGSYTAQYMVMECFRYAVTRDPEARENARKAFEAMRFLQTVTGTNGFVARTVVPATWTGMHDPGERFTPQERARVRIEDPRYKEVEQRWLPSADGQWLWKRDTSSDEMTGHFYGYAFYYDLVAEGAERDIVRDHVRRVMDYIIDGGYVLMDVDGTHTRWGVWAPERLNSDPDWAAERGINSVEILSYLKTAHHITGDEKYEREYRRLLFDCGYADNVRRAQSYAPAWRTHIDDELLMMAYPALLLYETDPALRALFRESLDHWYKSLRIEENPLANFTYGLLAGEHPEPDGSVAFLRDAPLDLVCWTVDNTRREDIRIVREPIWEHLQTSRLLPASERGVVRWDKNPWMAVHGEDGRSEWCPVFWLLPYWMGRYAGFIKV